MIRVQQVIPVYCFLSLIIYICNCENIGNVLNNNYQQQTLLSFPHKELEISFDYIYEIPKVSKINGFIFFAHGCYHSATDWFAKSKTCDTCIGLPIEMSLIQQALNHGYIVLAVSSTDRNTKCWTRHDVKPVSLLINHLYTTLNLSKKDIPLFFFGASSGGAFVGMLSHFMITQVEEKSIQSVAPVAICIQISMIMNQNALIDMRLPSIIFVLMSRDKELEEMVSNQVEYLKSNTKFSKSIAKLVCEPKKLEDDFFSKYEFSTHLNEIHSKSLVHSFIKEEIISKDTRLILSEPRYSNWRDVAFNALPDYFPAVDSLQSNESPVSELMNVAWSYHEITDEHIDDIFDIFDSQKEL